MYLLYCDETNLEAQDDRFFIYGGIAVSSAAVLELSRFIDAARERAKLGPDDNLKFNPRPEALTHEEFIDLKQSIILEACRLECTMFTSMILHNIARNPADARLKEINRVCYHFHCFLNRKEMPGMVLIDRFNDREVDHHLREKFHVGLRDMPYSARMRLEHIVGFHYTAIGQSNMCSLVDILLGSFRFATNVAVDPISPHQDSARRIFKVLSQLFFREQGRESVSEIGIFFSPMTVRIPAYRQLYERVHAFLAESGVNCEQRIRDA